MTNRKQQKCVEDIRYCTLPLSSQIDDQSDYYATIWIYPLTMATSDLHLLQEPSLPSSSFCWIFFLLWCIHSVLPSSALAIFICISIDCSIFIACLFLSILIVSSWKQCYPILCWHYRHHHLAYHHRPLPKRHLVLLTADYCCRNVLVSKIMHRQGLRFSIASSLSSIFLLSLLHDLSHSRTFSFYFS